MRRFTAILLLFLCSLSAFAQVRPMKSPNGKWGFSNKGKWEIQPKFDAVDSYYTFCDTRNFAAVKINGKWGCIDVTGQYITQPVLETSKLAGMAGMEWKKGANATKYYYAAFSSSDRKWGFVNCRGNFVIKPQFDAIDETYNFTAGKDFALVQRGGSWGCINMDGFYIVKPYFVLKDELIMAVQEAKDYSQLGENVYTAADPDLKKYGFVNYLGNWVVKPVYNAYDKGYTFSNKRVFAVVKYNNGWGCVNKSGKMIVKPTYPTPEAARKVGFQWQSTYKENVDVSTMANIDDGKHKQSLLMQGGGQILANGSSNTYGGVSSSSSSVVVSGKVPTINILNPKSGSTYSSANVTIDYEVHTFDGSTPKVLAYVNGELQQTKGVQRVGKQMQLTLPRTTGSTCHIQLIAKDGSGRNSDPAVISLRYVGAEGKPGLHLLAVGVSDYDQPDLKLQNAAKDAQDFIATVKGLNLSQYDRLSSTTLLIDKQATDKSIKKGLSNLIAKVNQGDVVLLFFSGHGAKEEGSTYFLSVNAESNDLFSSAVNFDEIRSATRRLLDKKCKIIIFMDACHSGALYGQKSTAESFALAEPGVIGFYSSTENQKSNESDKWSNGIFTKALLEGLKGSAADAQGDITLDQLEKYIRETVRKSTNGTQMPIFENKMGNFVLFKKHQ